MLKDEGWTTDAEGRVFNEAGRVIYKPGYVTAIGKIIGDGANKPKYSVTKLVEETQAQGGLPIDTDWDKMPNAGNERID